MHMQKVHIYFCVSIARAFSITKKLAVLSFSRKMSHVIPWFEGCHHEHAASVVVRDLFSHHESTCSVHEMLSFSYIFHLYHA
jgi:hypothetical protein